MIYSAPRKICLNNIEEEMTIYPYIFDIYESESTGEEKNIY